MLSYKRYAAAKWYRYWSFVNDCAILPPWCVGATATVLDNMIQNVILDDALVNLYAILYI